LEPVLALIDGRDVPAGEVLVDRDPSTGTRLADVMASGATEVEAAVAAARRTFENVWHRAMPKDRGRILRRISEFIQRDRELLARLESTDTGKPLRQAVSDVDVAARYFEYFGSVVEAVHGEQIPAADGMLSYTIREPYGVTAHIEPWNYPLQIGARTISASLAAGNCCVLKPAEEAPISLSMLGRLALEAGLPPGALNVVPGTGEVTGAALAAHRGIDHLSFTGSAQVGRTVAVAAAANLVPVSLELGGKSPNIVLPDADLDAAVPVIVNSILQNAGQTCSAGSRLLVHRDVYQRVVEAVADRMRSVVVGPGLTDPDMGPLISQRQLATVRRQVDAAVADGARLVCGGSAPPVEDTGGYYFGPTLLAEVSPEADIARQEVFGPVLAAMPFDNAAHAVALANATEFGLIAAVWTGNVGLAHRIAAELRCGQVYVNAYGAGGGVEFPFGGYKKSGYGREKGMESLLQFTHTKTVMVKMAEWPS
jgi:aldehyde dehydrogenase (NAD+)